MYCVDARRLLKIWDWHTDLRRVNLLGTLLVFVSDPDHLEKVFKRKDLSDKSRLAYEFLEYFSHNGLVTLNGAQWRAHRKAIQPAFHPSVLDRYGVTSTQSLPNVLTLPTCNRLTDALQHRR